MGGTVGTTQIANDAVTYAKIQNVATDRLLGRDTAGSGDVEEISLATSLEWSGSGSIQRSALTGDVTASAASNSTTIANDAVSNAKMANMAANTAKVNNTGSSGDPVDMSVGASTVVGRGAAGNIVAAAIETSQIADNQVTDAKIGTHTTTKITTSSKSLLNSAIVYTDQANVMGDFNTEFHDDKLVVWNPARTFKYTHEAQAITADSTLRYPDVNGLATLVSRGSTDTLTGKTMLNSANTFTFDADETFAAGVTFEAESAFSGDISPAQLTAATNDYNPTNLATSTILRLSTDASRSLTGIVGGADGRIIVIHNIGTNNLVLEDEDAGSSAANRFALNADFTLGADQSAILWYDSTSSRWRLIGSSVIGAAGGGEANTSSNAGAGGVGIVLPKSGVDLPFKSINAGSGAISVTNDAGNSEIDIDVPNDGITYAKIQNVSATDRILGRDTAAAGDIEELTLDDSLEFTGSGGIQRAALTGDVTASAGGNATTIANDAVTFAKMQDIATDRLLGRDTASTGNVEEISLGTGLAWSGSQSITIDSTVVTESSTDTLTNKTLTTPVLTTPTINGVKNARVAKTGNYTLTATDIVTTCDASGGAFTITLPAAATAGSGTEYTIIRTDVTSNTNLLTIDANSSETINGMLVWKLWQGEFVKIITDGSNWFVLDHSSPAQVGTYFLKNSTNDRRYPAGWHSSLGTPGTSTTSPAVDTLYALPFLVNKTTKFDTISWNITTLDAGDNANGGIYYDNGNCYPGALIFNTGSVSTGTTGVKDTTITASLQIFQPGLYWLAWETSAPACQIKILSVTSGTTWNLLGSDNTLTGNTGYGYSVADTYGATLPDPYPSSATILSSTPSVSNPVPYLTLRAV